MSAPHLAKKPDFSGVSAEDRISRAQRLSNDGIDRALQLMETYYAFREAIAPGGLGQKLPNARATGVFNVIVLRLKHSVCIDLCRFWDKTESNGKSIPTILEYVNIPEIEAVLRKRAKEQYAGMQDFAEDRFCRDFAALEKARSIATDKAIANALEEIRNFRDKLAHSLTQTRTEKRRFEKGLPELKHPNMTTVRLIGFHTIQACWLLHASLNSSDFDFLGARNLMRQRSRNFWGNLDHTIDPRTM